MQKMNSSEAKATNNKHSDEENSDNESNLGESSDWDEGSDSEGEEGEESESGEYSDDENNPDTFTHDNGPEVGLSADPTDVDGKFQCVIFKWMDRELLQKTFRVTHRYYEGVLRRLEGGRRARYRSDRWDDLYKYESSGGEYDPEETKEELMRPFMSELDSHLKALGLSWNVPRPMTLQFCAIYAAAWARTTNGEYDQFPEVHIGYWERKDAKLRAKQTENLTGFCLEVIAEWGLVKAARMGLAADSTQFQCLLKISRAIEKRAVGKAKQGPTVIIAGISRHYCRDLADQWSKIDVVLRRKQIATLDGCRREVGGEMRRRMDPKG